MSEAYYGSSEEGADLGRRMPGEKGRPKRKPKPTEPCILPEDSPYMKSGPDVKRRLLLLL